MGSYAGKLLAPAEGFGLRSRLAKSQCPPQKLEEGLGSTLLTLLDNFLSPETGINDTAISRAGGYRLLILSSSKPGDQRGL